MDNRITIRPVDPVRIEVHLRTTGNAEASLRRTHAIVQHLRWVAAAILRQRLRIIAGQPTNALDLTLWRKRN